MERSQSEEDRQAARMLEALFGSLSDLDSPVKTLDQLLLRPNPTNELLVTPTIFAEPSITIPNLPLEKEKSSENESRKRAHSKKTTMKKVTPRKNGSTPTPARKLEKQPRKKKCKKSSLTKTKKPETASNLLSSSTTEAILPPSSSLTCPPSTSTLPTAATSETPKPDVILAHSIPINCVEKLFDTVIAPLIKVEGDSQIKHTLRCYFFRNLVLEIVNAELTSRGSTTTPTDLLEFTFIAIDSSGAASLQ